MAGLEKHKFIPSHPISISLKKWSNVKSLQNDWVKMFKFWKEHALEQKSIWSLQRQDWNRPNSVHMELKLLLRLGCLIRQLVLKSIFMIQNTLKWACRARSTRFQGRWSNTWGRMKNESLILWGCLAINPIPYKFIRKTQMLGASNLVGHSHLLILLCSLAFAHVLFPLCFCEKFQTNFSCIFKVWRPEVRVGLRTSTACKLVR